MSRATILVLAALIFTAAASASAVKRYMLKHPKRDHCRAHYVRKVEKVKKRERGKTIRAEETFCVYQAPKPTSTPTPSPTPSPAPTPAPPLTPTITVVIAKESGSPEGLNFFSVDASVIANDTNVIGVPITYTLTNESTGQALASFTELTPIEACAIVYTLEKGQQKFRGEGVGVPPRPACHLGTVNIPEGQTLVLTGSFAGNSTYAPSVSEPQVL